MNLDLIIERYAAASPHGDIFDLALAHGLDIEHRHGVTALIIDHVLFADCGEDVPRPTLIANVAFGLAMDCMRSARLPRNDDDAEQIAHALLERTERKAV